jgi:hypothetical protein
VLVVLLVLENPYNIGESQYRRGTGQTISERDRSNIGRGVSF